MYYVHILQRLCHPKVLRSNWIANCEVCINFITLTQNESITYFPSWMDAKFTAPWAQYIQMVFF
jgi:hypothetical protein